MMETCLDHPFPLLMVSMAVLGTALGSLLAGNLKALKNWLLLVMLLSMVALIGMGGTLAEPGVGMASLSLIPLAAFASLLGQPLRREHRAVWFASVLLLGLGLGVLTSHDHVGTLLLFIVLSLVGGALYRYRDPSSAGAWWGVGLYGLGCIGLIVALVTPPPVASIGLLVASMILLPLAPLHVGYVAVLTALPGSLPPFLALLLPSLGFHGLLTIIPDLPNMVVQVLAILALVSGFYASVMALTQVRVRHLLAYASLAFFSILWWYIATTRAFTPQAAIYLYAVGVSTGGLLLTWSAVQARYGDLAAPGISGLARPMPRLAAFMVLLVVAAMGLPPFGVFSGFLGMFLNPSVTLSGGLVIILMAWLTASWYFLNLVQRLLLGSPPLVFRHEDLRATELASLLILVVILIILGITPFDWYGSAAPPAESGVLESSLWDR